VKRLASIGLVVLCLVAQADAQYYFGKNKIHYWPYRWRVIRLPSCDLYHHEEEAALASAVASLMEEMLRRHEIRFSHVLARRAPVILYSSHSEFQETNVIPYILPEGVAGFTEHIKGRVVVPATGNWWELATVLEHELTHFFMLDELASVSRERGRLRLPAIPLWYIEGLAELLSGEWTCQDDMVLADAVVTGAVLPLKETWRFGGGYLVYKEGESFLRFVADRFGEERVMAIMDELWRAKDFDEAFLIAVGEPLEETDKAWRRELKKRYYPALGIRDQAEDVAQRVNKKGTLALRPVFRSGSGNQELLAMAWVAGRERIVRFPLDRKLPRRPEVIRSAGLSADAESFHLWRSGLSITRDGRLAYVSKAGASDVLNVWDLNREALLFQEAFPGLIGLSAPSWNKDGTRVVLEGLDRSGQSDLYMVDIVGGRITRLTNDRYCDRWPTWCPGEDLVVFCSDRGSWGDDGAMNLCVLDTETCDIAPLSNGPWRDTSPRWSPCGRFVLFSSDRDGSYQAYVMDRAARIARVTNLVEGVVEGCWSPGGDSIAVTLYTGQSFSIFSMALPESLALAPQQGQPQLASWRPPAGVPRKTEPYKPRYGLDLVGGVVQWGPSSFAGGGSQIVLSDMLGDRRVGLYLANSADSWRDFLRSFQVGLSYVSLSRRIPLGIGAYRVEDYSSSATVLGRREHYERNEGVVLAANYPLSRFSRFESSVLLRRSRGSPWGASDLAYLGSAWLAYVVDKAVWGAEGPWDGWRLRAGLGHTVDLGEGEMSHISGHLDARAYWYFGHSLSYAGRILALDSEGPRPERFYLGGLWTLRGYPRFRFWGSRALLVSHEIRFPVVDAIMLRTPFGLLELPGVRGALFVDAGAAWDGEFSEWRGSTGVGLRIPLGWVTVIRVDFSRTTDFRSLSGSTAVQWGLGWSY
jgi:hypothetical protein